MNYALVVEGRVVNVIVLHPMNADEFPNAVPVDGYAVQIGDEFIDGIFYRDGIEIKSTANLITEEMAAMREALAELGVTVDE